MFTLSKHGRPLDWAVVAQEVWRWPDSQVNVDADVWQACVHSLCPSIGIDTSELDQRAGVCDCRCAYQQIQTAAHAAGRLTPVTCGALGRLLLLPVAAQTSRFPPGRAGQRA